MTHAFAGQRVVILGLARQGVALARFLAQAGARVCVSDLQPAEKLAGPLAALSGLPIEFALGGHPLSLLDDADLLCLSGGVAAGVPLAQAARARGIALSNDAQIFLEACPAGVTVVGITGSAGKTTTTTLVGRMLAAAPKIAGQLGEAAPERAVYVGGNIGNPLIAEVGRLQPGDVAVMELSSFQLEIMTRSPRIAAVLNLTPNHLDRHGSMAAYAEAKSHILRHQGTDGVAVVGADDAGARALAPLAPGRVAYFSAEQPVEAGAFLRDETLCYRWEGREAPVIHVAGVKLRGRHNLLNALAAVAIAGAAGASPLAMRAGFAGFRGVAHRLEFVREWGGARWYNDSIATAPERVCAAVRAFDEPLVLLLGGRDKQLPWEALASLVRERAKAVVLFGEAGPLIEQALSAAGVPLARVTRCATLAEAVPAAARRARPGDVVLLSPGGASFDEFRDFAERGERFKAWVRAY
ncbi:MAG: UDP-N-acetylmuramoyl-L-alanine--D-glutamate ligase [Anaerolineales bacterium]|nr:UDP-N-acetylmuramoyl-L-alanine--D-glutamate ligase [Anaerolineales bacterium]